MTEKQRDKQRRIEDDDLTPERVREFHKMMLGRYYDPTVDLPLLSGYTVLGLWVTAVAVSGESHMGVLLLASGIILAPVYLVYRAEQRWRASSEPKSEQEVRD